MLIGDRNGIWPVKYFVFMENQEGYRLTHVCMGIRKLLLKLSL